jgi:hypothetical protein
MLRNRRFPWFVVIALALGYAAPALESFPPRAEAQIVGGDAITVARASDGATIAWAARSGDGTKEFWAYVQGEFVFASSSHTSQNPWTLSGIYDSGLPTGTFDAFRTEVLSRAAAQGETIIFHNMTVTQSVTEN